jgi:hypothetical protein
VQRENEGVKREINPLRDSERTTVLVRTQRTRKRTVRRSKNYVEKEKEQEVEWQLKRRRWK